ncbi:hypothetical protein SAMN05414139_10085 [Burkholderia sp. D7]|nr:hypothetical protein SAMN05414139_10085 [Burkholderia sp. D7]
MRAISRGVRLWDGCDICLNQRGSVSANTFEIKNGANCETAKAPKDRLTGIQRDEISGPDGWVHSVKL